MKKCITTLASFIIAVCCSLAIAGQSNAPTSATVSNAKASTQSCPFTATTKPSTAASKKAPSFLFVLQAKQGKIETKNGKTYLVLQKTDVHHVIMFSDRPNRIVKVITGNDLQKLWKVGNNSFEKDPPNAVLSSAGQKAQIVILNGIEVSKDNVVFPISVSREAVNTIGGLPDGPLSGVIVVVDRPQSTLSSQSAYSH